MPVNWTVSKLRNEIATLGLNLTSKAIPKSALLQIYEQLSKKGGDSESDHNLDNNIPVTVDNNIPVTVENTENTTVDTSTLSIPGIAQNSSVSAMQDMQNGLKGIMSAMQGQIATLPATVNSFQSNQVGNNSTVTNPLDKFYSGSQVSSQYTTSQHGIPADNLPHIDVVSDSMRRNITGEVSGACSRSGQGTPDLSTTRASDLDLTDLNRTISALWSHALSSRTLTAYETGVQSFKHFLMMNNLIFSMDSLPTVSEDILMLFIAHCYRTLKIKYTTIKLYLCGIRFAYLKAGISCPLVRTDKASCARINALVNAIKRVEGQTNSKRQPVTASVLDKMCSLSNSGYLTVYMDSMLVAVCLTAFFGFLRCAEFTVMNGTDFDPDFHLCLGDLTIHDTYIELLLKSSKTDPFRQGITIQLFQNATNCKLCPFRALRLYLLQRNSKFSFRQDPLKPLFLVEDGTPLTRSVFMFHVKHLISKLGLNTSHYTGHSFRIGAGTSASSTRLEDHLIKTLGRWSSDCYKTYIRTPKRVIQEAQNALLSELSNAE